MNAPNMLSAVMPVIDVLEQLGMEYHIEGSVASSFYGVARATLGVDLIVNFAPQQIEPFMQELKTMYDDS